MKLYFRTALAIFVFVLIAFSVFHSRAIGESVQDKYFTQKNYGVLKRSRVRSEEPSKYQKLFLLESQGINSKYSIRYKSKPQGKRITSDHTISVTIDEFTNTAYAENDFLIYFHDRRDMVKPIQSNSVLEFIKYDGGFSWVSNEKKIIIMFNNVDPDKKQEILEDYLLLHAPTLQVTEDVFSYEKIGHVQVERSHEIIKGAEPMRILPARAVNRPEAYIGMVAQCSAEYQIRCWTGMYEGDHVDCPITLMAEDISRNMAWKEFKKESMSRSIIEDHINWASVPAGGVQNCSFQHGELNPGEDNRKKEDIRWLVLDELKMSPKELEPLLLVADKLPDGIMPEMFE